MEYLYNYLFILLSFEHKSLLPSLTFIQLIFNPANTYEFFHQNSIKKKKKNWLKSHKSLVKVTTCPSILRDIKVEIHITPSEAVALTFDSTRCLVDNMYNTRIVTASPLHTGSRRTHRVLQTFLIINSSASIYRHVRSPRPEFRQYNTYTYHRSSISGHRVEMEH